nr:DUF4158 domain-containing protein [Streptomyces canus]
MLVEFLTDEQAEAYGRFVEEPTRPELERFFYLDAPSAPSYPCSGSRPRWGRPPAASGCWRR